MLTQIEAERWRALDAYVSAFEAEIDDAESPVEEDDEPFASAAAPAADVVPAPILRGAPVGEIGYDPDSDEPAHLPSEREFRWLEEAGRPERPGEPLRTDDPRRIAAAEDRDGPERVKRRRSEYVVDVETGRLVAWRYVDEPRIMVGRRYATWGVGQPFPRRPVALLHRRGRARRRFCAPRRRRHTGTSASRGDPPQGDDDPPPRPTAARP